MTSYRRFIPLPASTRGAADRLGWGRGSADGPSAEPRSGQETRLVEWEDDDRSVATPIRGPQWSWPDWG